MEENKEKSMEELIEENKLLNQKLEALRNSFSTLVQTSIKNDSDEKNQLLVSRIQELERELKGANKKLEKLSNLEEENRRLQERLADITKGSNWEKAVDKNKALCNRRTAVAVCCAVKKYTVKEIVEELNYEIGEKTVYDYISVRKDSDYDRIIGTFHKYSPIFREYGVTKQEVEEWFKNLRIKKLKLLSKDNVIEEYGDILGHINPDTVVQDYYNPKDIEAYQERMVGQYHGGITITKGVKGL